MRSSVTTVLELGDLQRWAALGSLVLVLVLEVVDVVREWPRARPPIAAVECLDVCEAGGVGVQVWTYDGCTCQGADEPRDTGGET